MEQYQAGSSITEDLSRLAVVDCGGQDINAKAVVQFLKQDLVVLIQNVVAERADLVVRDVAAELGLMQSLELQAGLAGFQGHRRNLTKYFMTVNKRRDYQFITPHSEGSSFIGMQLAAFFCYENSTDGGETILMNVDDSSQMWQLLREKLRRAKVASRPLAKHEIARAKGLYQVRLPSDILRDNDQILGEHATDIPGLTVLEVLAKPEKTLSRILDRELNVFWDTVESADFDSVNEYVRMLKEWGLLRQPDRGLEVQQMDTDANRRVWHSGVEYARLFKSRIVRKLAPGDLIIQNNLTWTHAVSNWSPGSGTRRIAGAFA